MLENASSTGIRVNTIVLAFTLVAGTVVFLRLFTRLVLTKGAGFEDVCIAVAMLLSIGLAVVTSEQVMHGLGKHIDELSTADLTFTLKMLWASLWIYNLALTVTKVSILVQYIRIFPPRHFRCACYAVLCIVIACGAWGIFGNVFLCYPVNLFWDKTVQNGRCMNEYITWFTTAGLNIGQDLIILLLPTPVIRSLQISRSQKKELISMLALSASVTVVSTVRLYSLEKLANSPDQTFDNSDQATLSAVEVNVGIICACLPAMRPLFAIMMPKYFSPTPVHTTLPVNDIESQKDVRALSVSTRGNTPVQSLRPIYSRADSSTQSVETLSHKSLHASQRSRSRNGSIAHTRSRSNLSASMTHTRDGSNLPASMRHTRSGSNLSIVPLRSDTSTFQSKALSPLRKSPVIPFAPFAPSIALRRGSVYNDDTSALVPGLYSRRPGTQVSTKPLPLTPFPVWSGDYTDLPLTAIPRPAVDDA